ncbi:MAG TPA: SusC/RagA family TonB-linked outer membrane protein [Gemmatimonadaceae bacterium]|nr:SusC/RagA family TonB-linked outer membrane protein [Gemmatimonadaceae bacterium]
MRRFTLAVSVLALIVGTRTASAQRRLTGTVTEAGTGQPVDAATITIAGTTIGVHTGDDGRFAVTIPSGAQTVRVRRIGYRLQDVPVGADQSDIRVALVRDVLQLEAEIITGAVTSVARANAANDVAQVSADQLLRAPTPTLENALQAKIAGATVTTNSGAPGGGAQFRIRGASSILGNSDPLIIVDGVIVSNQVIEPGTNSVLQAIRNTSEATDQDNGTNRLADLNPNDIENIEILKGASAASIYGSRASNGVVVITTKRGTSGAPSFSLTQRVGTFALSNKLGERHYTLAEALTAGQANGMSAADVQANYSRCNGYCDFEQELYGNHNLSYETSLSSRGGNQTVQYFTSGLIKRDNGIAPNSGYDKQSALLNVNTNLTPRWTASVKMNVIHSRAQRSLSNNDNVNVTPYFVIGFTPSFFDIRPQNGIYPNNPFTSSNPLQTLDLIKSPEDVWREISSVRTDYSLLSTDRQQLVANVTAGIDHFDQTYSLNSPRILQYEPNDALPGTLTYLTGTSVFGNGGLSLSHTYRPTGMSFTTSAGFQHEYRSLRVANIITKDVVSGQQNVERGASKDIFDTLAVQVDQALYAQEEWLGLNEHLLLTAAVRGQRSTVNGNEHTFYLFPKAAASYRLTALPWHTDEVKFRLAYGAAGNPPLMDSPFTPMTGTVYSGENGLQVGPRRGNSDIKPERQTELEGGVDVTLLNSRGSLSLTGYRRTITDLLLRVNDAPSKGFVQRDINGGEMRNTGIEIAAGATPIQTRALTLVSHLTFARNVGTIVSLPDLIGRIACVAPDGQSLETDTSKCPRGFQTGGFDASFGVGRIEEGASPTQIVANDTLKDGTSIIRKWGDTEPDFSIGFANDVTFGNFRVSGLLDWRHGFKVVNLTQLIWDAGGNWKDPAASNERLTALGATAPYVQSASFLKLRELSLAYVLPQSWATRVFGARANGASVELSGRNLLTWTKYEGLDPEVSNFGNQNVARNQDVAPFPPSRSFFLTLNVNF